MSNETGLPPGLARTADDGRNIDLELGTLSGEGAQQRVRGLDREQPHGELQPRLDATADGATYYGLPVLKETVWKASIPAYFYVGGLAGASAALGAAALARGEELRGMVRACRFIAAAGALISGGLLIEDLGRPARFLHMFRVFRPSSPMNLGTWILSAFGALSTGALLPGRPGDAAAIGAGVAGLPLAGYTAVLLVNTAVPVWQGARTWLPVLFVSSAAMAAGSAMELLELSAQEQRVARRFAIAAKVSELLAGRAVEAEVSRIERVGRPLHEGAAGILWRAAKLCTLASLAVSAVPRKPRWLRRLGGVLGPLGSLATRFAIFEAGRGSARDPKATFEAQRAGAVQLAGARSS
jgi:hypothetical protein